MFLNNFGEPVAVEDFAANNLDRDAPLLLASPNQIISTLPESWSGIVYTTRRIVSDLKRTDKLKLLEQKRLLELQENNATEVRLSNDSRISITAFVWTKGKQEPKLIFQVKDKYLTRICVDALANNLNIIITNNVLRKAIKDGIDIVHFNDRFAKDCSPKDPKVQHIWYRLHILIYLLRPKKVCGLYNTTMPKYVIQCCNKPDLNRFV
ncbi:PREDICTED: uncharacterized protein LOC108377754 [Rhagoletis zephyria]|uniref:uncharacterized protein LOC108377754 n=1 Tax=Rhagoletis zephyria TaxID=28612 RepID=UPI0008113204|nr:PREDICTED: uncharacterized protein LOC108377754 [Rhagoletis zephyria]XP_017489515.1 PREDICTED: uncharacterized protein LOC108377754 [Rhagoletis zephyria]